MSVAIRTSGVFVAGLLIAMTAAAQERVPAKVLPQDRMAIEAKTQLAPARVPVESKIVKGAPYTADVMTEMVQTLSDGNRIVQRTTGRVYRDSQGRMRREDDAEPGQPARIAITDPVAGVSYSLEPATRTAWKTPAGAAIAIMKRASPADPADVERKKQVEAEIAQKLKTLKANADEKQAGEIYGVKARTAEAGGNIAVAFAGNTEKLPARSIEGVMAEGTRTTWTIPAGAIGNEQPIVTVTEQWRSPELQVLIMTRSSDPRTGESTYKLQNIQRGEQSHSWFEVPPDYTVKESGIRKLMPTMK